MPGTSISSFFLKVDFPLLALRMAASNSGTVMYEDSVRYLRATEMASVFALGVYLIVPGGSSRSGVLIAEAAAGADDDCAGCAGCACEARAWRLKKKEPIPKTAIRTTAVTTKRNFLNTISTLFPRSAGILARAAATLMLLMFNLGPRFSLFGCAHRVLT
jgi:hypothetical protein